MLAPKTYLRRKKGTQEWGAREWKDTGYANPHTYKEAQDLITSWQKSYSNHEYKLPGTSSNKYRLLLCKGLT